VPPFRLIALAVGTVVILCGPIVWIAPLAGSVIALITGSVILLMWRQHVLAARKGGVPDALLWVSRHSIVVEAPCTAVEALDRSSAVLRSRFNARVDRVGSEIKARTPMQRWNDASQVSVKAAPAGAKGSTVTIESRPRSAPLDRGVNWTIVKTLAQALESDTPPNAE